MSVSLQSNLLASLAADVREAVSRFKRASLESFEAYLTAGGKLVEARGECRRGQWGPFLAAAGLDARTARDMMTVARAGLTAGQLYRHGGIRGTLEALRAAAAGAVDAAGDALDRGDDAGEITATVAVNEDAGEGAVDAREAPVAPRAEEPAVPARPSPAETPTAPLRASTGLPEPVSSPLTLRQWRRSVGRCADCGEPCPDSYRCEGCREARTRSTARAAARRRIGRELEGRIEGAAAKGRGVRLTAGEVRKLVR